MARAWHVDVAKFLLELKADVNAADNYGRTALHVAAAVDYPEMVLLLIENKGKYSLMILLELAYFFISCHSANSLRVPTICGNVRIVHYGVLFLADKEAGSGEEKQTAVHYAAKNDACLSLKTLIKEQCLYKDVRDYKGRTPLHLAAELGQL